MTTNKKAAPAEAASKTTAKLNTCDYTQAVAEINILESACPLTVIHHPDGLSDSYLCLSGTTGVTVVEVQDLDGAAKVYEGLYRNSLACIAQGAYVGDDAAERDNKGQIAAGKGNFKDSSAHLINLEINWTSKEFDPVLETEKAILAFIERVLPECFHGASFIWRLKHRSEKTDKQTLGAYLTFWLEAPLKLSALLKWCKADIGPVVLPQSFSVGHPEFTADPIFEAGMVDSIPQRHGYYQTDKKAVLFAPKTAAAAGGATDKITILETLGPKLTKTYTSDGATIPYEDAASFKVKEVEVSSLSNLAKLLGKMHKEPKQCFIRGKFVGADRAEKGKKEGTFLRNNANFDDQPLHWFMLDIDGYVPGFADPVHETEQAVLDFLTEMLPAPFKAASYYWHLSSSAGMPGKEKFLKCHVHFWSRTAYTTAQMHAWAKLIGPCIDAAVYRRVQAHYTADPVFREGRTDPVPVRAGWHQGETDDVDLQIGQDTLAQAREQGAGQGGNDMKLVDPSEKEGLIGLFNRVYSAEDVLLTHLDEFEQISERRYTWLNGGGTPEGVWVHDDGMHVGSSHNTWPIDGIVNLWDLVRVFKFGHLDHSDDDFVQEDIDSQPINAKPSNIAMLEWAGKLPELMGAFAEHQVEQARERHSAMEDWRGQLQAAPDEFTVREVLCKQIATDDRLTATHREALAVDVNAKLGRLAGNKPGLGHAKKLISPPRATQIEDDKETGPTWLRDWYYVTDKDKFFRYDSDEWLTMQGFNSKYSRKTPPGDEGNRIPATVFALEVHPIPVVVRGMYLPGFKPTFTESSTKCVNTYRPSSVPKEASLLDAKGKAVVELVKQHVLALVSGREWLANLLLDWIAHNVQNPGIKIRFSFVIQGIEGDGKSLIGELFARTMGQTNVRIISPEVISKSDFNGWAEGACVGVLEELRLQGQNRFDVLNSIKPSVANPTITIHRKKQDPYNAVNTMNYIAFTNHKDALPLDDTDRRWVVVFTPWENIGQFEQRVGCVNDVYFDRLFTALDQGAAYLRRYFLDRDLSTFNRNSRAPDTEEKRIMVSLGVSDELTTAKELIAEGGYGFGPEIVSTRELNKAMEAAGVDVPQSTAMKRMMSKLGFQQVEGQIKWDGYPHRVWTRKPVTDPIAIRCLLDATASRQLEEDFKD